MLIPDFITHYSRGEPFLSITSLSDEAIKIAIENMNEKNCWGRGRFKDSNYLVRRRAVEFIIRQEFIKMGGKPVLQNPIYFFLGTNLNFEKITLNIPHKLNLKDLPKNSVSFSYGDSLLSYDSDYRSQSEHRYQNTLCEKIYTYEQLPDLIKSESFPDQNPLHIEAHLWVQPGA